MIRLSKSCVGEGEKEAVCEVLSKEFLGMGADVQNFENRLQEYFGRPVVCVNTGTAALHLSCQAIGMKPGDEVLVPTITYVASFQAISATGAAPVPCDVTEADLLIDLNDAERRLSDKTRAIMPVHYAGNPGNWQAVYDFAQRHSLRVIEDAAHAFGSEWNGKRIGSIGDVACFSFDGIKNITSGEGGCIVTEDREVLRKTKDARLLGVVRDTDMRYSGQRSWEFDVIEQGWRYHMSNIMAAIGLVQLQRFPDFRKTRRAMVKRYFSNLEGYDGVRLLPLDSDAIVAHIFPVILNTGERKMVQERLQSEGIQTGVHYLPNHYLSFYGTSGASLPAAQNIYERLVTLPLHADLTESQVDFICTMLKRTLEN